MRRFVVLEHDHPRLHWDLMLEAGETLRSWRLAEPPAVDRVIAAERIGDHRRAYLDYEGPVSGGRGSVKRFDAGTFEWIEDTETRVLIRLDGVKLRGTMRLEEGTAVYVTRES